MHFVTVLIFYGTICKGNQETIKTLSENVRIGAQIVDLSINYTEKVVSLSKGKTSKDERTVK